MFLKKKLIVYSLYIFLFCYISLFFFQKVNFVTSDLGRHIQNGRVIVENKSVFETNLYSYTHPNFPVTNHHWLFGVITFYIFSFSGFNGLTVFSVLLYCTALIILFLFVKKHTSTKAAFLSILAALPFLTYRTEFRPEVFSYLFVVCTYIVVHAVSNKSLAVWKAALILLPLQLIWVNTHIFFIFSFGIVGVFGIRTLLQKDRSQLTSLFLIGILLLVVSFCNPLGLQGLLEPFSIFTNYGYKIAENQGLLFMSRYSLKPIYLYFYAVIFVSLLGVLWTLKEKNITRKYTAEIFLCLFFILFGLKINRLLSFTGIFIVPFLALYIQKYLTTIQKIIDKLTTSSIGISLATLIGSCVLIVLLIGGIFIPGRHLGLGIFANNTVAAEFFTENKIAGPIFNNYDIGGYLIYNLYPQRVFVDNRPEAYPRSFFTDTYVPMQQSADVWQEQLKKYDFNTIFFYRHDMTEWAQQFLVERVQDSAWVPIFVDDYAIIFVRNTDQNKAVIEKYRIPQEVFSINK